MSREIADPKGLPGQAGKLPSPSERDPYEHGADKAGEDMLVDPTSKEFINRNKSTEGDPANATWASEFPVYDKTAGEETSKPGGPSAPSEGDERPASPVEPG